MIEHGTGERWESLMEAGLHALEDLDTTSACECFEAAAEQAEAMGPDEPRLVSSLRNLVGTLGAVHRYADAEPMLERILDLSIRTLGADHPDVIACLEHLAWIAEQRGERERAMGLYRTAYAAEDRAFDEHDARGARIEVAEVLSHRVARDLVQGARELDAAFEEIAARFRSGNGTR